MDEVDHYANQRVEEVLLGVLNALDWYVRWNKVEELPAEISRRIKELQAKQQ